MQAWPSVVDDVEQPDLFRSKLDDLATTFERQARQKYSEFSNALLAREAGRIATKAGELLSLIQDFHSKANGRDEYESDRELARDHIVRWISDIDGAGVRQGMDAHSIQPPLLGLVAYMEVLQHKHVGADSRNSHLSRNLVRAIVRLCWQAGIHTDRRGSAATKQIVNAVFSRINAEAELLRPLADREVAAIRTAFEKLGDSPEFWRAQ